ncbi:unnamed protein product, partial [Sphagnum tenellum]
MAMEPSSSGNEEQQQQQQETKASQLLAQHALQERHHLKPPDQVVACPRCQSLNTKFCYYNNYSLTQPRHFCKNCRRYWTAGGTLRNVPFGGGCRKNKRAKRRNMDGQSSSGTENSETDHSMAAAEQHTLLGSSSAGLFGTQVHLYGGHVTSWKNDKGEELLFLSSKAIFKPPKAIRGGIPICFPQFGTFGSLEQHGFARNRFWVIDPNPPPPPTALTGGNNGNGTTSSNNNNNSSSKHQP